MSNCLNCGKVNPPSKGSRKRKYCSNKCANDYYTKEGRYYDYKKKNPNWGSVTRAEKLKAKQNKEHYERLIKEGWIPADEAAKQLSISKSALHQRIRKLKITPEKGVRNGVIISLLNQEQIELIKKAYSPTQPPEGYLTLKEAAEYLGYTKSSLESLFKQYYTPSRISWQQNHSTKTNRFLYTKKDLDSWMADVEAQRAQASLETELRLQKKREEKRLKEEQRQREIQREIYDQTVGAGLIPVEEAVIMLQIKSPGPLRFSNIPRRKINGRLWFNPQDVKELKKQRDEEKIKIQEDIKMRQNKILRNPIKGNESYELRRKQLFQCDPPKWVQKSPKVLERWNSQSIPWEEEKKGNILTLDCDMCGETKDYKDFPVSPKNASDGRWCRHKLCKPCVKKKFPRGKKSKKSPKGYLVTKFGNSIHSTLSKRTGAYVQISHKLIWQKLEYSREEFLNHIESKFAPWMTFENNLKPKEGVKTWQLDHIVPKSTFEYTSMDDEGFKQAWALDNLQPLESTINEIKSDKKLRVAMNGSFRRGIQSCLKNKTLRGNNSIWKFLDYTPSDAVDHIKSKFDKDMSWENWGDVWQLDHVVPQAYLSYTDPYSDNFKQCWKLSNLKPVLVRENSSKSSRYKNKLWHYNDV